MKILIDSQIIDRTVALLGEAENEYKNISDQHHAETGKDYHILGGSIDEGTNVLSELLAQPRPKRYALQNHLEGLKVEELQYIVALKRIGSQETSSIEAIMADVVNWDTAKCIDNLVDKSGVSKKIRDGLLKIG